MINRERHKALGLVAESGQPELQSGSRYDQYFSKPKGTETKVIPDGSIHDIVLKIGDIVRSTLSQTSKISKVLEGDSIQDTCKNIFDFIWNHIEYKLDDSFREQLRTPNVTWHERRGDCDDFAIMISSILTHLGIKHVLRITQYLGRPGYEHIYVIAFDGSDEIVIDPVLRPYMLNLSGGSMFNQEKEYIRKKDYTMEQLGIPVYTLAGIPDNETGDPIYDMLIETRQISAQYPSMVSRVINPQSWIQMLDYAIQYWHTDKRDEALSILVNNEQKLRADDQFAQFFQKLSEYKDQELSGWLSDALDKVKDAFHDAGQWVSNAISEAQVFNPIMVVWRGILRTLVKYNYMGWATRFQIGRIGTHIPNNEHKQFFESIGIEYYQWKKIYKKWLKIEGLFREKWGGKGTEWNKFKDRINEGKYKGAAIGKYGETKDLRKVLQIIEDAALSQYGISGITTSNPDQLGDPGSLAAAITEGAAVIATISLIIGQIEDAKKLVKDAGNVFSSGSNKPSSSSTNIPDITVSKQNNTNTNTSKAGLNPILVLGMAGLGIGMLWPEIKGLLSGKEDKSKQLSGVRGKKASGVRKKVLSVNVK